jgi:uncharacterized protein
MQRVIDNAARNRFELEESGHVAFANYVRRGDVLLIPHVEAPMALRGTGAAQRLMEGLLAIVRERGEKVIPTCSYASGYLQQRQEHHDLLG